MSFKKVWSNKKTRTWVCAAISVALTLQIYFVRDMLAALALFTIAFAVLVFVALVLYVVDRVSEWGFRQVREVAASAFHPLLKHVRLAWHSIAAIGKKQIRRLGSQPAR